MKGTSKLPSRHLSADRPLQKLRGCFLGDNAAVPPAYRVKVQKCASFVDILDVCKFTTFCDRKGYLSESQPVSAEWSLHHTLLVVRQPLHTNRNTNTGVYYHSCDFQWVCVCLGHIQIGSSSSQAPYVYQALCV